jgi:hypothetical protein
MEQRVEERTATLRMLSGRLLKLQDAERRRFSRELHDSAGQLLVALDLNLARLEKGAVPAHEMAQFSAPPCAGTWKGSLKEAISKSSSRSHPIRKISARSRNCGVSHCARVSHQRAPSLRQQNGQGAGAWFQHHSDCYRGRSRPRDAEHERIWRPRPSRCGPGRNAGASSATGGNSGNHVH